MANLKAYDTYIKDLTQRDLNLERFRDFRDNARKRIAKRIKALSKPQIFDRIRILFFVSGSIALVLLVWVLSPYFKPNNKMVSNDIAQVDAEPTKSVEDLDPDSKKDYEDITATLDRIDKAINRLNTNSEIQNADFQIESLEP